MLDAVLFDWGDTLMQWAWDPQLLDAGHAAGLRALGREPAPGLTARFRETALPRLLRPETLEEVDYAAVVREALAGAGIVVDDEELARFLAAEHSAWQPARMLASTTHALLDALRESGLRLGLVSNAIDPPWLLHRDLEQLGVAERLDVALFSSEVGWRKPHPAMFERALGELGVDPDGRCSSATASSTTSAGPPPWACAPVRRSGSRPTTSAAPPSRTSRRSPRWTS